jgi:DNA-binding NtrC family response regulator
LFLDEIGELDPRMQVKLLRVLDGTPYYRLGGVRKISVDVRIVSATNLNLEEAVRTGRFRSDLYHRLSQMHLKVPPLRERPDDVAALACHFLRQQDSRYSFAPQAIDALRRKYWAGNVRELRNLVSKSVIFADGFCIGPEHLAVAAETPEAPEAPDCAGSMVSLERLEKQTIFKALEQSSGHHQRAAELLGISRRTLSRRLKIYGAGETQETSVA